MKKLFIIGAVALATSLVSCNDLLDKNPLDTPTNTPAYWSNEVNLENQCNAFYNNYSGYGNAGAGGWFYFKTLSDDQVSYTDNNWTYTNVPSSSSSWNDPFTEIRRANYIIDGVKMSALDEDVKAPYEGMARLNRAWQYFQLVRKYGDIQWIDYVMDPSDAKALYAKRDDRDMVMDKVLEDLHFATKVMKGGRADRFNVDMAYAMLADVALYEGTYCKYRTAAENAGKGPNLERANKYLNECVKACEFLMAKGYKLNPVYKETYNSVDLSANPEVIFYKPYSQNTLMHSTVDYTMNTSGTHGMTRDAFEAFLFKDGKPAATTSCNTADLTYKGEDGHYHLDKVFAERDGRLAQILDPVLVMKGSPYSRSGSSEFTSTTGYGVAKYDNTVDMTVDDRNNIGKQFTDAPLYWLSVIYLNFAEAKAELGTLTQTDLDNSINKLQARVGLPNMTTAPAADPANNMGVSAQIWEIRRCRRCELMFDNWYRYWDLIRWHQLELLDTQKHPKIYEGANLSKVENPEVDLTADKYMQGTNTLNTPRHFNAKHYFYPVPSGQRTLNENLTQNPGWE